MNGAWFLPAPLILLVILLTGCIGKPNTATGDTLHDVHFFTADDYNKQEGVALFAKRFDADDTLYYFNTYKIKHISPIQITIMNERDEPITLDPTTTTLPLLPTDQVVERFTKAHLASYIPFIKRHSLTEPVTILPGTTASYLLFVPNKQYPKQMHISLLITEIQSWQRFRLDLKQTHTA